MWLHYSLVLVMKMLSVEIVTWKFEQKLEPHIVGIIQCKPSLLDPLDPEPKCVCVSSKHICHFLVKAITHFSSIVHYCTWKPICAGNHSVQPTALYCIGIDPHYRLMRFNCCNRKTESVNNYYCLWTLVVLNTNNGCQHKFWKIWTIVGCGSSWLY